MCRVSILLIVELAFEDAGFGIRKPQTSGFQSFLSWNWLLKWMDTFAMPWGLPVSILLIVELAFEECFSKWAMDLYTSFNPSYRGIGFWRKHFCFAQTISRSFNPSYRGIGFWRQGRRGSAAPPIFVSILLIVELAFEAYTRAQPSGPTACFNPSYRGIGFWRPTTRRSANG